RRLGDDLARRNGAWTFHALIDVPSKACEPNPDWACLCDGMARLRGQQGGSALYKDRNCMDTHCVDCGRPLEKSRSRCPACGTTDPTGRREAMCFFLVVALLVAVTTASCLDLIGREVFR
ncbi:hypothetical protein, partial [Caballeronia calidae]|uniref:hypothetical protein n=1 Tax=Caballeronia calidae TaxID=1777139 RepID=UPI001E430EE1